MKGMADLFRTGAKIVRWIAKRPVSILPSVALIAWLAVGTLGTAATESSIKVMFLRGGVHDWKNNPTILKTIMDWTNDRCNCWFL